jgi:hypothetical protein
MSDDENGLEFGFRVAAVARYEIALAIVGSEHVDIRCRKAGIEKALRHRLCCGSDIADRVGRIDLDEFFEDIVRHLPRRGISGRRGPCNGRTKGRRHGGNRGQGYLIFHGEAL